jgi:hypothetical protein
MAPHVASKFAYGMSVFAKSIILQKKKKGVGLINTVLEMLNAFVPTDGQLYTNM